VALSLQTRSVGDIGVVSCNGRIVEGDESAALDRYVRELLPLQPHVVLDLTSVPFIDSSGLGLLVRLLTRARAAEGDLKLCAVDPRVQEALRVTRLKTILPCYDTEADAVSAFYQRDDFADAPIRLEVDILCVDRSPDVLAYTREVLKQAGYGVTTASNLPDALTLLRATRPRVVVIGSELHSARTSGTSQIFNELADAGRVVELPPNFSREDAGEAARNLLGQLADAISR
jgi:anti-sigma B factor antagonist